MLKELMLNFAILSVYLFLVSSWFIRKYQQSPRSLMFRLSAGATFGMLGVILLFFSINVNAHTHLNMRGPALILAAFFGGPVGALFELFVVYVARWFKEGSLDAVQMAIGVTAALGTGIIFSRIKRFSAKWVAGTLFLLNYYYFGLWLAGQIPIDLAKNYIMYQAGYSVLIAGLLYYLIKNHDSKKLIDQAEQEMIYLLRMQPGYTFRFQKRQGKFYYTLIEGQFLKRMGAEPSDFIGKSLEEVTLFSENYKKLLTEHYERAWQGEQFSYEMQLLDMTLLVTLHPVLQDGTVSDVVGTGVDISDVKKRKEADESNMAKSRFLAQMSHEIRTPINAIIGLNYILQHTNLDERQRDYADKSITAAKSLLAIVNDVLDFSKIEAGKVQLEQIEFDLYEVLHNLSNLVSFKAYEKGLKFRFSIHHEVPQMLVGDPIRLQQVLLNVMNNAVKFTSEGELAISVGLESQRQSQASITFSIRDTGIGMSADQIDRLFHEFTQADMTTTRKYGGTGLGLVISQKFVEMMGGTIGVESELGRGSTFTISVPMTPVGKSEASHEYEQDTRVVRVLFVCADFEMQWVLRRQLEQLKCSVNVAADAADAMDMLERTGPYVIVLLDWKLQGDDPLRFAHKIGKFKSPGQPIVMVISAYHETELQAATQSPHIAKAVLYPISQSQLYNEIVELVALQPAYKPSAPSDSANRPLQYTALKEAVVLLVEDNEINQIVAQELLREVVARVDVARDGSEAVSLASRSRYDAILMDLQMPVMDGYEATRCIRQLEEGKEVPIIAMTADAMKGVEEQVLAVGMNAYITKPFDPIELYNMLQRFVRKTATPDTTAIRSLSVQPEQGSGRLDREGALKRLGGNGQLYVRILKMFVDVHARDVSNVREAIATGDYDSAVLHAHSLKRLASNIGAIALAATMAEVQAAAQCGTPERLSELLSQADNELEATIRATNEALSEHRSFAEQPIGLS
ncbi:response regulator [Cohnella yongneupensis]|uniref:histidine kinase n=1 Tax=Cohnella yongneupensis TaxID=425006 RepID=A0ABW0QXY3_9BACL